MSFNREAKPDIYLGVPTPAALSEFLKKVLYNLKVEFTVAPYSALAQVSLSHIGVM